MGSFGRLKTALEFEFLSQHKASRLSLRGWRGAVRLSHSRVGSCGQQSLRVIYPCSSPSLGGEASVTSSSPLLLLPFASAGAPWGPWGHKMQRAAAPDKCELHGSSSCLLLRSCLPPNVHLHTAYKRDSPVSGFLLLFSLCVCVSHSVVLNSLWTHGL